MWEHIASKHSLVKVEFVFLVVEVSLFEWIVCLDAVLLRGIFIFSRRLSDPDDLATDLATGKRGRLLENVLKWWSRESSVARIVGGG